MVKYYKSDYFLYQFAGTHIVATELTWNGESIISTKTFYRNQPDFRIAFRTIRYYKDECKEITEDEYKLWRIE